MATIFVCIVALISDSCVLSLLQQLASLIFSKIIILPRERDTHSKYIVDIVDMYVIIAYLISSLCALGALCALWPMFRCASMAMVFGRIFIGMSSWYFGHSRLSLMFVIGFGAYLISAFLTHRYMSRAWPASTHVHCSCVFISWVGDEGANTGNRWHLPFDLIEPFESKGFRGRTKKMLDIVVINEIFGSPNGFGHTRTLDVGKFSNFSHSHWMAFGISNLSRQ